MFSRITKSASESAFQAGNPKLKGMSNNKNKNCSTDNKLVPSTSSPSVQAKHINSCRICHMICISDAVRIMCPYCGAFYDPSFLKNNGKKTNKQSLVHFKIIFSKSMGLNEI